MIAKINRKRRFNAFMSKRNHGFTLIEILVAMGIFALITSVTLVNHRSFSENLRVENLAYDIALTIRKAQVFGLSVKVSNADEFTAGYGVYFNNNNTYLLFSDDDKNDKFNTGDDILETIKLPTNFIISDLCAGDTIGSLDCSITSLGAIFNRPDPSAIIIKNDDNISSPSNHAQVIIRANNGTEWKINITGTGQISVEK